MTRSNTTDTRAHERRTDEHRAHCFHCAEPIPRGCRLTVTLDDGQHPVCCAGCQAVVQTIVGHHLERYYQHREQPSVKPDEQASVDWAAFDRDPRYWGKPAGAGKWQLALLLDGIRCAACVWLIQSGLGRLSGVSSIDIDLVSGYTEITWDSESLTLSRLMAAIQRLGYRPHLLQHDELENRHKQHQRRALTRLLVAGLGMMQVMMYAVGLYAGDFQGMSDNARRFLEGVSLLVTTPVVFYAARPFFAAAWRNLKAGQLGMDVPVSLAIGLAYGISCWHYVRGAGALYFDSVVMFVFFLTLARYLEMRLNHKNLSLSQAFGRLLPSTARRWTGAELQTVPALDLVPGDHIEVPPGEVFPADGVIVNGETEADEALITGEAIPVAKRTGSRVIAGSGNLGQPVRVEVKKTGPDNTANRLAEKVLAAQLQRPQRVQLANRLAKHFTALVLLIAGAVAWRWIGYAPDRALSVVLSVLVVSCPCALSLATPAALAAANRRLLKSGLLITRNKVVETLNQIRHVVFDKTGTLTRGRPTVTAVELSPAGQAFGRRGVLAVIAALERHSEHPVAAAFDTYSDSNLHASNVRLEKGQGLSGTVAGEHYRIGPADRAKQQAHAATAIRLSGPAGELAICYLNDDLRVDAKHCVERLREAGLNLHLLTGDGQGVAQSVADEVALGTVKWKQTPEDKVNYIKQLQRDSDAVLMVGDGINDAPVLAAADASVAVHGATQLAKSSADILLAKDRLMPLVDAFAIARITRRVLRQNMAWAIGYNLFAIPFAAMGWVAPWMAAIGMSVSSLIVVLNASRIARYRRFDDTPESHPSVPLLQVST